MVDFWDLFKYWIVGIIVLFFLAVAYLIVEIEGVFPILAFICVPMVIGAFVIKFKEIVEND